MRKVLSSLAVPALLGVVFCTACNRSDGPGDVAASATSPPSSAEATAPATAAAVEPAVPVTLFQNVRVFDGKSSTLSEARNVLVRGNVIERISAEAITVPSDEGVTVIDGNGRTLMPGMIDNHWHVMLASVPMQELMTFDVDNMTRLANVEAKATLMRGFTTVRDLGGPSFALKRTIDAGEVVGPRVYPSGAMITITGGHGDFRALSELPRQLGGPLSPMELTGGSMVADSPDEVRVRAREQLTLGASQVKLTAGGGVASPHSPLDVTTFNEDELRAAVQAAENWGTYVVTHAYTPAAMQRSIAAGVKVIEHGHLMDEETARMMAEKGIWLSFQPFTDLSPGEQMAPANRARLEQVVSGTERTVELAKQYGFKMAIGTDILFSADDAAGQTAVLTRMGKWYSAPEVMTMLTATNAELLKLSGPRDPYPGKLGVVEEGALADLLLVEGNPLENLELIEDSEGNFVVIMKDGRIYKNALRN
ncbi:amidohydrolase family protein [Luteimonas sp. A534]